MKAEHKKLVAQATAARKAIKEKMLDMVELENDLATAGVSLAEMREGLSQIEAKAAASGLSVSDLHAAVKL